MPEMNSTQLAEMRRLVSDSFGGFLPEAVLSLTICLILFTDVFRGGSWRRATWIASCGLILSTLLLIVRQPITPQPLFGWIGADGVHRGLLQNDGLAWFFKLLILLATLFVIPMARIHVGLKDRKLGEFYALLLSATLGMFLMVGASNLLMIYLAIEFASMSSYLLTAYLKSDSKGSEAGLKYVLYGSVASASMLYGLSLIYGLTGSLHIGDIAAQLQVGQLNSMTLMVAAVLSFAGFAYKMAAFPMHFWCPDVYQGATTPVTAYLSVASKAAGFAIFMRFLMAFGPDFQVHFEGYGGVVDELSFGWRPLIAIAAALSMTVGNLSALAQTNVKRMLAYSSIAHAGYLLMGVAAIEPGGGGGPVFQAVLFYFLAYFAMNLGAFFIVNLVTARTGREDVDGYRGMSSRSPFLALCFLVFLISLIGLPPTGGFMGKWLLFSAAIGHGMAWLAVVAGLNTAISTYFYARLIKAMYLEKAEGAEKQVWPTSAMALLGALAALILVLGLMPDTLAEWASGFGL